MGEPAEDVGPSYEEERIDAWVSAHNIPLSDPAGDALYALVADLVGRAYDQGMSDGLQAARWNADEGRPGA